jgi:hypothetical protein
LKRRQRGFDFGLLVIWRVSMMRSLWCRMYCFVPDLSREHKQNLIVFTSQPRRWTSNHSLPDCTVLFSLHARCSRSNHRSVPLGVRDIWAFA